MVCANTINKERSIFLPQAVEIQDHRKSFVGFLQVLWFSAVSLAMKTADQYHKPVTAFLT